MFWIVLRRVTIGFQVATCALIARPAAGFVAARGGDGLTAAATVRVVGPTATAPLAVPTATCPGSSTDRCYDSPAVQTSFVNVGSFFDRRGRTTSQHYFVKLFSPATPGRYQIEGMSFVCNRAATVFPAAGVVPTSAETPIFPSADQLLRLQALSVSGQGPTTSTCVDLSGRAVVLESGQAAWLVLNFPDAADSVFIGVKAETDAAGAASDHGCDFMTRDAGEYWYRPDPRYSPYDWMIAAHYDALPSRAQDAWTTVKLLYR
jgi:hypothetical protein